jgi:epoxyqueuosine reductase QueG
MSLNETWERFILDCNTDFVYFVDASVLPSEAAGEYKCAVLFGKVLSKDYINSRLAGDEPPRRDFGNTENRMDRLAVKIAAKLEAEGFKSAGKFKTGVLPHKTVALRAGLGFIGKNNLLVTERYGCAVVLGKVLTAAPFYVMSAPINEPKCGGCEVCVNICPTQALLNKTWSVTTTREDILVRKRCVTCLKCMIHCPYTVRYAASID